MRKFLSLLSYLICSVSFASSIQIEIWGSGGGGFSRRINEIEAKINQLKENGVLVRKFSYEYKQVAICGAFKTCFDIAAHHDSKEILSQFTAITDKVREVASCPESDEKWIRSEN